MICDTTQDAPDSLKKRYFYKLFANLLAFALSILTAGIVPRGLGPKAYGDFNYLSNFFSKFLIFLDSGSSTCFYTKLSHRPKDSSLVSFYAFFGYFVSALVIVFIIINHIASTHTSFWPEQGIMYIYLGAGFGIFSWLTDILNKMTDAQGLTVLTEKFRVIHKLASVVFLVAIYVAHKVNLLNYFYYQYFFSALFIVVLLWIIKLNGFKLSSFWSFPRNQFKQYCSEFASYSSPLLAYSLIVMLGGIFDRWLLQMFGGSIQQGYFGFSFNISSFCVVFTTSITPLLMREFAIAHGNQDLPNMVFIFSRFVPMFYFIAAFFSCFIAIQSETLILLLGGKEFRNATLVMIIMSFYPVQQTYGQMTSSVFMTTGNTKLVRNLGTFFLLLGLPVTYFLIAPRTLWGLESGAVGLALKTVMLDFVSVNVYLFFAARLLKISFWRFFSYQLLSLGCLITLSILTRFLGNLVLKDDIIWNFLFSGFLYSLLSFCALYYYPALFGIDRTFVRNSVNQVFLKIGWSR